MSSTEALVASLIVALLLAAAFGKPVKKAIGGVMSTKKGRTTMTFWPLPTTKKTKKKRKRRR